MRSWWDEVPYAEEERQPFTMQVETTERFSGPCGFVQLRERHRIKAQRSVTNEQDRRCRIRKVRLKPTS